MTSTRSRGKKPKQCTEKENSSISISSQVNKVSQKSSFDFDESDDEQFDVKSNKRTFRTRKASNSDIGRKGRKDPKGSKNQSKKTIAAEDGKIGSGSKRLPRGKNPLSSFPEADHLVVDSHDDHVKRLKSPKKKHCMSNDTETDVSEKTADIEGAKNNQKNENPRSKSCDNLEAKTAFVDNLTEVAEIPEDDKRRSHLKDCAYIQLSRGHETEESCLKSCPVCLKDLPTSATKSEINIHVNACLDSKNAPLNTEKVANVEGIKDIPEMKRDSLDKCDKSALDEVMAKSLQEREDEMAIEEALSSTLHFCAICQKDLNHLSTGSRQVHLNKCADISEKETESIKQAEALSAKGNRKSFECIICGCMFSTVQQRITHMKQCSKDNKVDQRELLKLVKETNEMNAALMGGQGLPRSAPNETPKSSVPHSSNASKISQSRRGKSKRKLRNEEVPIILTRSEADAKRIAASMAIQIIEEQTHAPKSLNQESKTCFPKSSLASKYCRTPKDVRKESFATELDRQEGKDDFFREAQEECSTNMETFRRAHLWDLADNTKSLAETSIFYVVDVFHDDYIRTKNRRTVREADEMELGNNNESANGARLFPQTSDQDEGIDRKSFGDSISRDDHLNESFTLTQSEKTAIIENLGKSFAADDVFTNKRKGSGDSGINQKHNEICSGFVKSELIDYQGQLQDENVRFLKERARHTVVSDMKAMLSDESTTDITIMCADGRLMNAHRCIIFARCPKIRTAGKQIDLKDFSEEAVRCFLEFVYSGEINVSAEIAAEVFNLANCYSMDLLMEACRLVGGECESTENVFREERDTTNHNPDDILKKLLGNDDDGDDDDEDEQARTDGGIEEKEGRTGDGDSPFNESDEEDLREYFVTQKVRRSSGEESCELDEEDKKMVRDENVGNEEDFPGSENDDNSRDNSSRDGVSDGGDNDSNHVDDHSNLDYDDALDCDGVVGDACIADDDCIVVDVIDGHDFDFDGKGDNVNLEEDSERKRKILKRKEGTCLSHSSGDDNEDIVKERTTPKQSALQAYTSSRDCNVRKSNEGENLASPIEVDDVASCEVVEKPRIEDSRNCSSTSRKTDEEGGIIGDGGGDDLLQDWPSSTSCQANDELASAQLQKEPVEPKQAHSDEDEDYFGTSSSALNFTMFLEKDDDEKKADEVATSKFDSNIDDVILVTPATRTPQLFEKTFGTPALYSAGTFSNADDPWDVSYGNTLFSGNKSSSSVQSGFKSNSSDKEETEISPHAGRQGNELKSRFDGKSQEESFHSQRTSLDRERRFDFTAKKKLLADLSKSVDIELSDTDASNESPAGKSEVCMGEVQDKSIVLEPLSPCVTTSQFARKPNSIDSDETENHVVQNVPCLSQRNVIDVDAEDQSDAEEIFQSESENWDDYKTASKQSIGKATSDILDVTELASPGLDASEDIAKSGDSSDDVIDITASQAVNSDKLLERTMPDGSNDEVIDTTPTKGHRWKDGGCLNRPHSEDGSMHSLQKQHETISPGHDLSPGQRSNSRRRKRWQHDLDSSDSDRSMDSKSLSPIKSSTNGRRKDTPLRKRQRSSHYGEEVSITLKDISVDHRAYSQELAQSHACPSTSKGLSRSVDNSSLAEPDEVHLLDETDNDYIPGSTNSFYDDGGFNPDLQFGTQTQAGGSAQSQADAKLLDTLSLARRSPCLLLAVQTKTPSRSYIETEAVEDGGHVYELDDDDGVNEGNYEDNGDEALDCYIDDGGFNCDVPQGLNVDLDCSITDPKKSNTDVSSDESLTFPVIVSDKDSKTRAKSKLDEKGSKRDRVDDPIYKSKNTEQKYVNPSEIIDYDMESASLPSENTDLAACSVTPSRGSIKRMKTPNTALRNFGPGCIVHPETGVSVTPMTDYDSLHTPELTKRVKQFGMRKLAKRQMAAKLREIYKVQHGFTRWEEAPPKAQRKRKAAAKKVKEANSDGNKKESSIEHRKDAESEVVRSLQHDENCDAQYSSSSSDERQKTFEGTGCSDDEAGSQASQTEETQSDEGLSEKLMKFMKSNKDVYHRILTYQKLSFDEIYKAVKDAKIKCTKASLMDFLDDQCICVVFTRVNDQAKPRRRRWKKK